MKTLNLSYPNKSNIKFKVSQFPDGQQDINILDVGLGGNFYDLSSIPHDEQVDYVQIKSRLNSFKDLELIICATKALKRLGVKKIHLYIPYLLGARSDRQFVEGGTSYLVDVIAPIINAQGFKSVTVIDVHSDVAAACIERLKVIGNTNLVSTALDDLYLSPVNFSTRQSTHISIDGSGFVLISPDGGALKKIYKVAEAIGYKGDVICCSKSRDTKGKLSKTIVPLKDIKQVNRDFIIIDDICDGGATFINIAKEIKNHYNGYINEPNIYLVVTHGIFSKGFEELSKYFDGIYCTNSYQDIPKDYEIGTGSGIWLPDLVKQLNVF